MTPGPRLRARDSRWQEQASCRGAEPHLFSPPTWPRNESYTDISDRVALAQRYCMNCPVRDACLTAGLRGNEWGVWGGVMLDAGVPADWTQPPQYATGDIRCGTDAGYRKHRRNDEAPCEACLEAHSATTSRARERKKQQQAGQPTAARVASLATATALRRTIAHVLDASNP